MDTLEKSHAMSVEQILVFESGEIQADLVEVVLE